MNNILIVDDSTDLLEALEYFLTEKGYKVKCVSTTENLLPVIRSFLPDLVLLDIFLQDGSKGTECGERKAGSLKLHTLLLKLFRPIIYLMTLRRFGSSL